MLFCLMEKSEGEKAGRQKKTNLINFTVISVSFGLVCQGFLSLHIQTAPRLLEFPPTQGESQHSAQIL